MEKSIEIKGLSKKYGDKWAVQSLDLDILHGELLALLGVNGVGKTTLINMLSCAVRPTEGDALVLGCSVKEQPDKVKQVMAKSPQQTAVAPKLTVMENLELMAGAYGLGRAATKQRAQQMMAELKLGPVEKTAAYKLSGGWQRRLSIAMALISRPQVLFLDEPTLGLDVLAREQLWDVIRALKSKTTILLTTHYMQEAEQLADRVCIMDQGRLLAQGTPQQLKQLAGTEDFERAFVKLVQGGEER